MDTPSTGVVTFPSSAKPPAQREPGAPPIPIPATSRNQTPTAIKPDTPERSESSRLGGTYK